VLVVDDEPAVLAMLERLVASWGFRTIVAGTFEEGRASLDAAPDALVTDVRLGDYNGLQLVHLAKQRNPSAIVVAVSGIDDAVLRKEAANAGAAYLLKPLELPQLKDYLSGNR
jgi:DNA-binding response OmpR family regulator